MSAARHLAQLIAEGGPVSIATLMDVALAHPTDGYYRARPGIGEAGDFITAPEISQLFGEMIGIWVLQSWLDLGSPARWQLIELGPGHGTLVSDLVRTLRIRPQALERLTIHLVETSEVLRRAQHDTLVSTSLPMTWHARLDDVPDAPSIFVANEFFDALPIRQFVRLKDVWCERRVALFADATGQQPCFEFVAVPTLADVVKEIPQAAGVSDGSIVEMSQASRTIAVEVGARLARQPGRALIVDYGYSGEHHGDTLQAVRGHQKAGPLQEIGHADLTAHVDFAALAASAREGGAISFGPVAQGAFLKALGIEARFTALGRNANEEQRGALERGLARLTDASQMGEMFRVLALSSPDLPPPPGFTAAP